MAEFRTLGGIEFTDLDPARTEALLAQPKRVALLGYLLLGEGGRGCRRRSLIHLFWPDSSRERGRGSLRSALHYLRKQLGRDAILSRGEAVRVNSDTLRCDAVSFNMLIAESRLQEGLDLYDGDFLPGLEVPGSPNIVGWLEAQRARLRRAASSAAWMLSESEERRGNWISAADLARRATELDGDHEQSVRRLLRLLDRVGDRVAALRQFESFRTRWAREFGLDPSPETVALAEAIRIGSQEGEAVDSGDLRARTPRPSRSIAVLPFTFAGDGAGQGHLGAALAHEIIDSLSRLSEVRVISRSSVDRYRVREGRTVQQIAKELGTDVVLDGSLRVLGDRMMIVVRLIDARTDAPIWGEIYEISPKEALSVGIRLVLDVLDALRIRPPSDQVEYLEAWATADPDAYALYLEGRSLWNRRSRVDAESAARLYERALEIDQGFARAWAGLADVYLLLHPAAGMRASEARVRAREAALRALRIDPRLGEAHATLGLLSAVLDQDWNASEEQLLRAVDLSPGLATAHHWLGSVLAFIRQRFEKGSYELALALQLDPHSPTVHCDLGLALFQSGRRQEALLELRTALELEPDFWRGHYDLGVVSFTCGDPADGVEHLERAWAAGAWGAKARRDAPRPSKRPWRDTLERKLTELAASPPHRGGRAFEYALVSALLGQEDRALKALREAATQGSWAFVMQYYPVFEALHGRREFKHLLVDVGLGPSASH